MIYQAAPKVKILTLPKQFGLTAKSFFSFARADFNDITYEKQHIPQQEQGRSHKKSVSALLAYSPVEIVYYKLRIYERQGKNMKMERTNYSSGAPLEEKVGYSRMVKIGPYIKIGGTTSVQPDGTVYGEDAYEQTKYVLEKQIKLLEQANASAKDVFSVFIYTTDISQGARICEAYSEFFHDIKPLNTMVEISKLNRPTQFVEIEIEAMLSE